MSRMTRRYIQPIDSTGALVAGTDEHGKYVLAAGQTYYFIVGGAEAAHMSVTMTGYTSTLVITSATIQDTDHAVQDVTDFNANVGEWINEDPPSPAFVAIDGTGWAPGASPAIVTASGAGVGGARWNLGEDAATRTRLAVVVGAAGGTVRVSAGGKAP